jgi:RimJ/RimL family protein N-acetyltransferase
MNESILSVREMQQRDIESIANYFLHADSTFLINMGVDLAKVPARDEWVKMLSEQLRQSYKEKRSYCIIWQVDNKSIGHSNVNKIIFGEEAYMHLHIWTGDVRKKGIGTELVKKTLPYYFKNLKLKKLYCEPNAFNAAPNKTLEKVGFQFVKNHVTTPGWLNFEQPVNLWELSYEKFMQME